MKETPLVKTTLLLLNQIPGVRAWRQNTGVGYGPGELDKLIAGESMRPVTYGVPGAADITGVIGPSGRRLEVELKAGNGYGQTEQQKLYQKMIERHGGLYLLGVDPEKLAAKVRESRN